jgi:hypothetical protein
VRALVPYFFVSCILVAIIASSALSSPLQVATPSDADWTWLNENFQRVLDRMFALEKGKDVLISYRSYETLQVGDPEYSFSISERGREGKSNLFARIHVPDGSPIGRQLLAFHKESPTKPIEEAEKELKFRDWELTEKQCPALRIAIQRLAQARLGWKFDTIIMDPRVHEFSMHSYTGNLDAAIFDDANPLVRWALDTRNSMRACGAESLSSTNSTDAPKGMKR